jgi:hypothetical protein
MPVFSFIFVYILIKEKLTTDNIYILCLFIAYGTLAVWAFIESIAVLKRRLQAAQERVALKKRVAELQEQQRQEQAKDTEAR